MKAFHGEEAIKDKYLKRVIEHQVAGELVRSVGYENENGRVRACAVGCTLNNYDHKAYGKELGIPEWLARVEDTLFEGMTLEKSKTWPEVFLRAIKPGATLEKIKGPFLIMVLESCYETFDHKKFPDVKICIDRSIALWRRGDIGSEDWKNEAEAAWVAALVARGGGVGGECGVGGEIRLLRRRAY